MSRVHASPYCTSPVGCSSSTLSKPSTNDTCGSVPLARAVLKSANLWAPGWLDVQLKVPLKSEPSLYTAQVTRAASRLVKMVGVDPRGKPQPVHLTPSAVPSIKKSRFGNVPLRIDPKGQSLMR